MARHALSRACLTLVQCLERVVSDALAPDIGARPGRVAATPPDLDPTRPLARSPHHCRIGLSGGADSLALVAAAAWVRDHRASSPLAEISFSARVIDHGLQVDSDKVAAAAAQQSEALGIAAEVRRVEVQPTTTGTEAAARQARYDALLEGETALILLAHTLDDQAETVLLGLARGSGTRSLAGMPPIRDQIVRPFLTVRRTDTEQACRDWGLTWWNDPTNTDPAYTRSRLRTALPQLDDTLGPGLPEALARTADLCRADADYLDELASHSGVSPGQTDIDVTVLRALPDPIRHRVLLAWLRHTGADAITRAHVLAVDALVTNWHGQKGIDVPGSRIVRLSSTVTRRPYGIHNQY